MNRFAGRTQFDDLTARRPDPLRAARVITALEQHLAVDLAASAEAGVPKHVQLSAALVRTIEDGIVVEGDKLPSEAELTAMTPYSLGTVQKAVKSLLQDGVVLRKTGVGTIVRGVRRNMLGPLHCRFSEPDDEFLPVYPRIVARKRMTRNGRWSQILGRDAKIWRLDREIRIDDRFAVLAHFYVDAGQFPFFAKRPLRLLHAQNFKMLMSDASKSKVTHLDHRLGFMAAGAEIAPSIEVEEGTSILRIKVTARDNAGQAAYYQEFFIPPNDLELAIESRFEGIVSS